MDAIVIYVPINKGRL